MMAINLEEFLKNSDGTWRNRAYYYSFQPTGCNAVDGILAAVAAAGKAYHHTESWLEDDGRGAPMDWIQDMANKAAEEFKRLDQQYNELLFRYCENDD